MITLAPQEVERRIRAWAEVTQLSLELKRAALRKRYPHVDDRELARDGPRGDCAVRNGAR